MAQDDDRDPERLRRELAHSVVDPAIMRDLGRPPSYRVQSSGPIRRGTRSGDIRRDGSGRGDGGRETGEPTVRIIVELNPDWREGAADARERATKLLAGVGVDPQRNRQSRHYLFVDLSESQILSLAEHLVPDASNPILRLWRDEPLHPLLDRSVRTVKADASMATFGADGRDIVVAVADSGVHGDHSHFGRFGNLVDLPAGVAHRDFTGRGEPLSDGYGHGTHVAGIIAGRTDPSSVGCLKVVEVKNAGTGSRSVVKSMEPDRPMSGVAPRAKIVSLKVLDDDGRGYSSSLMEALEYVHETNEAGRHLRIHCVNLSLGYPFDADWMAAGHSPLCEVVNRLSRSGVVVVAAAGNDGSIKLQTEKRSNLQRVGLDQSINDPGNADEAITVGATHAESPHMYGVSFFSSRGPTADGRVKPDLVAPGERIVSCASPTSSKFQEALASAGIVFDDTVSYFREESGTSMAAPHVAGAVAAFLSIRKEFIGRPQAVKSILMASCTDLKRKADFQGAGLLDVLRAIQFV